MQNKQTKAKVFQVENETDAELRGAVRTQAWKAFGGGQELPGKGVFSSAPFAQEAAAGAPRDRQGTRDEGRAARAATCACS